ncbi:hypothetical protein V7P28_45780, partial [Klebsiella michiganensis]
MKASGQSETFYQLIEYAGKKFLIDPMLSAKGAWAGFAGTARSELRNPL